MNKILQAFKITNSNIVNAKFEIKKNVMMILLIGGPMLGGTFVGWKIGWAMNSNSGLVVVSSMLIGYFIGCGFAAYFATICDNYTKIIKENG